MTGAGGGHLTVEALVTGLIRAGFQDRWPSSYGDAVVQVTADGETFFALVGPTTYSDGGVVFDLVPWPPDAASGGES